MQNTLYFPLSILKIQLELQLDGELALGSPEFFLFFSLSTVHWHNSNCYIEAFYLDKLVTEKRAFVLLIFFKNKTVAILNFWLAQIPRQILDNHAASFDQIWKILSGIQENDTNTTKAIARKNNGTTEKAMGMSLFWVQLFSEDEAENGRT